MKLSCLIISILFIFFAAASNSKAAIIEWADSITDTNAIDPNEILGKPDTTLAHFAGSPIKYGTVSGFGAGDNIHYNTDELASLLNVNTSVIEQADLISIEYNGSGGGVFEGSHWIFDDGINTLDVSYSYGDTSLPSVISVGIINNDSYANYFSTTNHWGSVGNMAFILFDIDGTSAVNPFSSGFRVTLTAGSTIDPNTPEPDVMGRIAPVPIPGSLLLLGTCLICLCGVRRKDQ